MNSLQSLVLLCGAAWPTVALQSATKHVKDHPSTFNSSSFLETPGPDNVDGSYHYSSCDVNSGADIRKCRMNQCGCGDGKTCAVLEIFTNRYGSENDWSFDESSCGGHGTGRMLDNSMYRAFCCLPTRRTKLNCLDSYGDGWHGGYIHVLGEREHCRDFSGGSSWWEYVELPLPPPTPKPTPSPTPPTPSPTPPTPFPTPSPTPSLKTPSPSAVLATCTTGLEVMDAFSLCGEYDGNPPQSSNLLQTRTEVFFTGMWGVLAVVAVIADATGLGDSKGDWGGGDYGRGISHLSWVMGAARIMEMNCRDRPGHALEEGKCIDKIEVLQVQLVEVEKEEVKVVRAAWETDSLSWMSKYAVYLQGQLIQIKTTLEKMNKLYKCTYSQCGFGANDMPDGMDCRHDAKKYAMEQTGFSGEPSRSVKRQDGLDYAYWSIHYAFGKEMCMLNIIHPDCSAIEPEEVPETSQMCKEMEVELFDTMPDNAYVIKWNEQLVKYKRAICVTAARWSNLVAKCFELRAS